VEGSGNHDEWFIREVEKGLAAADSDEFIDHADVGKMINNRYPG
jgi:predicted transcriptional regulator